MTQVLNLPWNRRNSTVTPEREAHVYEAFISYSHAADERLAPSVQSGLERFAKPWYRTSGMRVFRDETNLAVNPALWASIQQALADSAYFVLLASPRAAASKWVKQEVEFWLARRGAQTLLIAHTDGTIQWDPEAADFDWRQTDALPSELRNAYPEEPKYADFTWAGHAADLSLRNPRFATEVARLVSAVRDRPLDELIGDDVRQRRRVRAAVAAAFLAIAAAATTAFLQWQNAETRGRLALSRQLANQGLNQLGQQFDLALLLGVEATRVSETVDARGSLLGALRQQPAFVTYLRAHAQEVLTVAISLDGRIAVSGDATGKLVFWDLLSRKQIPPAINQGHRVGEVAISPDGAMLASGSADHSVLLWDMRSHRPIGGPLRGHSGPVNSVAFSPSGKLLVSGGSDGMVFRWDPVEQRQRGAPLKADVSSIFRVRFSPDGKLLVAAGLAGARLLEIGALRWKGRAFASQGGAVLDVAFAPDSKTLATAHLDHTILLHDVGTGRQTGLPLTEHTNRVHAVAFTIDGKFMLSGDTDGQVLLRDTQTLKPIGPPWKASRGVSKIAVSPDGRTVVTANWDGSVALWNLGGNDVLAIPLGQGDVTSVAFSPDSRLLISGGYDGTTNLWDTATKRRVTSLPTNPQASVQSVAFSLDGSRFASSDGKGRVVIGGTAEGTASGPQPTGRDVQSNVVFTGGAALLYGTAEGVVLWDVERGVESAVGRIPNGAPVVNVAYSKAVELAAVSDRRGSITLLDARTLERKAVRVPMGHAMNITSLAFSPNGRMLASASFDGAIVLWSLTEGGRIWEAASAHGEEPLSVAFSPDGALLASGSADGNVVLWDVATGQAIGAPLSAHPGGVDAVDFSPDGRLLASAGRGAHEGVKLWEIGSTVWRARACAMANRDLTDAEWLRYVGETRRRTTCSGNAQ